jgi:hypothetical protein
MSNADIIGSVLVICYWKIRRSEIPKCARNIFLPFHFFNLHPPSTRTNVNVELFLILLFCLPTTTQAGTQHPSKGKKLMRPEIRRPQL